MSAPSIDPGDLLDLKLMPAWVKEPSGREDYAHYKGEELPERAAGPRRPRGTERSGRDNRPPRRGKRDQRDQHRPPERDGQRKPRESGGPVRDALKPEAPLDVSVQFLPRPVVLDNVLAQVKGDALAYSLFFLARSFLEKPQRYEVAVKAKPESPLYRLGETGPVTSDRTFLESNAFRLAREQFYRVEVAQAEPLKGNFTSIARCRLSGTVLGPTNHHDYQRRLRNLYEQRFSRRMSFPDYQRQIDIVSDPAAVEQWKEQARNVTTFVSLNHEPAVTFSTEVEAERDFRQNHLPSLMQSIEEAVIDGVSSRELADPRLRRHIEQAWSVENRSPSHMMQELGKKFRDAGLHIFRHRRGMLFVSSIRVRPFLHDEQGVSAHVKAILELVASSPRIRRKEVADKLLAEAGEDLETRKLALASDLRWLISEGYVIEFNDGALDLPRVKTKKPDESESEHVSEVDAETIADTPEDESVGEVMSTAEPDQVEAIDPNRQGQNV
jgi:hypothetical protein